MDKRFLAWSGCPTFVVTDAGSNVDEMGVRR